MYPKKYNNDSQNNVYIFNNEINAVWWNNS